MSEELTAITNKMMQILPMTAVATVKLYSK